MSVTVFASADSWIAAEAVEQCHRVAALDGVLHVAGMPDLHPGKGAPIGAAIASRLVYPHLVGSDIGCGIALFRIGGRLAAPEKLARRFPDLDDPLDDDGLGTVGRGNHFAELARVGTVLDAGHAERLRLDAGDAVLVVHTGSRGLGESILGAHTERHGTGPSPDPDAYLAAHDGAVAWASKNRRAIADRVAAALGVDVGEPVLDQCHNHVEPDGDVFVHRKGAAPGDGRDVLVAGSRGTPSYVVAGHAGPEANRSVAHGAGRRLSRSDALSRLRERHTAAELRRTPLGSIVVCGDRRLLFEEAPAAYKRIERVVADLVEHGLATPVATTVPLVTYKTAEGPDAREKRGRSERPGRGERPGPRR